MPPLFLSQVNRCKELRSSNQRKLAQVEINGVEGANQPKSGGMPSFPTPNYLQFAPLHKHGKCSGENKCPGDHAGAFHLVTINCLPLSCRCRLFTFLRAGFRHVVALARANFKLACLALGIFRFNLYFEIVQTPVVFLIFS